MGKTFRRGGSERGSYYPGKSIRDKRQNNNGTYRVPKGDNSHYEKDTRGQQRSRTQEEDRW